MEAVGLQGSPHLEIEAKRRAAPIHDAVGLGNGSAAVLGLEGSREMYGP